MKNKRRWGIAAVALLIGGSIWHASQHQSTGPAEGGAIQGIDFLSNQAIRDVPTPDTKNLPNTPQHPPVDSQPAETVRKSFRVGTFNLHGCKGLDGRLDVQRNAKCLENLDFVALQEVHGPGFFGGEDQAALLGKRLKMAWLFAPAVRQWYSRESGNGFLTSLPVTFWQRIPLQSHLDYSFRNVVLLGLKQKIAPGQERTVHLLVAHINRRHEEDRKAQLRAVIALFMSLQEPAILLGDLNSLAQDPQIAEIINKQGVTDVVGKKLGQKDDPRRIDWIFARGLNCLKAGILENDASDHPMVWAELE